MRNGERLIALGESDKETWGGRGMRMDEGRDESERRRKKLRMNEERKKEDLYLLLFI